MTSKPKDAPARELMAAALTALRIPTDDARLEHLNPLFTTLLSDGELLTSQVSLNTEPFLVARALCSVGENAE